MSWSWRIERALALILRMTLQALFTWAALKAFGLTCAPRARGEPAGAQLIEGEFYCRDATYNIWPSKGECD